MAKRDARGRFQKTEPLRKAVKIAPVPVNPEPGDGTSTQPEDDPNLWTPEQAIPPPEDLDKLAALTATSRTRRSCIAAIVGNSVGLGWTLEATQGREEEADEKTVTEAMARIESMARKDERLHRPNFRRLISAVKWDEQEVGNGYLEVSRNKGTGEVDGLYHAIGKRVRRHKDRDGWLIGQKGAPMAEIERYYDFGTKVRYDKDGKPQNKLEAGKRWATNELIPFQLYTSESRDYGLPPDAQLAWDYLGDQRAAQTNAGFFDGSAVPPTILFLKASPGGVFDDEGKIELEVDPKTAVAVADSLRTDSSITRRVAIVPLPEGVDVQQEQLAVRSERDVGFVEYRRDNRRATLGAFRLAPIFVADIEDTNYSTAEVERAVTKEQVFDPEQERTEDNLEALLAEMGLDFLRFKFTEIKIGVGDNATTLADHGAIQNGEYREALGFPRLTEADEGQEPEGEEVPAGWNAAFATPGGGQPGGLPGAYEQNVPGVPNEETVGPAALDPAKVDLEDLAKLGDDALFVESIEDAVHRVAQMVGPEFSMRPMLVEKGEGQIVVRPYTNGDTPG